MWTGPFTVPAGGKIALHFNVDIDPSVDTGSAYDASFAFDTSPAVTARVSVGVVPLILVPGLEGSVLKKGSQELWPNAQQAAEDVSGDPFLNKLKLDATGTQEADGGQPVVATEPVKHVEVKIAGHVFDSADFYNSTEALLERPIFVNGKIQPGYVLDENLFEFPYDWRKSAATVNADALADKVREVLAATHASKVDLMAHSQGGLVVLGMLRAHPELATKIRRIVTIATPVLGAPKALSTMEYQTPCIVKEVTLLHCVYDASTISAITRHMPGAYELMPSPAWQQAHGTPLVVQGVRQTYQQWTDRLRADSDGAPGLVSAAGDFHSTIDTFKPDHWMAIYGSQLDTIVRIQVMKPKCSALRGSGLHCVTPTHLLKGSGDETVPTASAAAGGSVLTCNAGKLEHVALVKDPKVIGNAVLFLRTPSNATRTAACHHLRGGCLRRRLTISRGSNSRRPAGRRSSPTAARSGPASIRR